MNNNELSAKLFNQYISMEPPLDKLVKKTLKTKVEHRKDVFGDKVDAVAEDIFNILYYIIYSGKYPKYMLAKYDFNADEIEILLETIGDYLLLEGDFEDALYALIEQEAPDAPKEVEEEVADKLHKYLSEIVKQL